VIPAEAWAALGGIAAAIAAIIAAFLRGQRTGRTAAERDQMQDRITGAQGRANADRDAARSDDPAAELRKDWRRGL
jgi:hypothetical protein